MCTKPNQIKLGGPVMGTNWNAELVLPASADPKRVKRALAETLARVDMQMSTWKPQSDLMRLNNAPVGDWTKIPFELMQVLSKGLEIGRISNGAFDIGLGDITSAWGFNAREPNEEKIRENLAQKRDPSFEVLELDEPGLRVCKRAPLALDLSGIAKGYGVDRMMQVCDEFSLPAALVALDGELRGKGVQADGSAWAVAIENPDYDRRVPLAMLELRDAAVATSGDYRHWVEVGKTRFSHTMDPGLGGPVQPGIASVSVVAENCMNADAMATAILVKGVKDGRAFAQKLGVDCLILERTENGIKHHGIGPLFVA